MWKKMLLHEEKNHFCKFIGFWGVPNFRSFPQQDKNSKIRMRLLHISTPR